MRDWAPERIARAAGARPLGDATGASGPARVVIDSRAVTAGDLFVGLPGAREDGGAHAAEALAGGAWGVLVSPEHADQLPRAGPGIVLAHPDPLGALERSPRAWRRELGASVVAITGSTGKTSTKDILATLLATRCV